MTRVSPKIINISWGRIIIEGYPGEFKDVKLFPGGAKEWDWQIFGTRHIPGIHPDETEELIEMGAEIIVLSTGYYGRLKVPEKTLSRLKKKNIEFHVLKTGKAAELYNRLCEEMKTGALIHTTC